MIPSLHLPHLAQGMPGLTPYVGGALAEAAALCLELQEHEPSCALKVSGSLEGTFEVYWEKVTPQIQRTHNDVQDATEMGACGIAALVAKHLTGLVIVLRSRKNTGFDYWLGEAGSEDELFQNKKRLEVTGILKGSIETIRGREKRKIEQTKQSDVTLLPALIMVVEFATPQVRTVER